MKKNQEAQRMLATAVCLPEVGKGEVVVCSKGPGLNLPDDDECAVIVDEE